MADLTLKERLQPSLLDRLTDREPGTNRESRDRRMLSEAHIRESVIRDLEWLLNTGSQANVEDWSDYPEVERSVLNYGVPELAGTTISATQPRTLERALKEAILIFEPRIDASSLQVIVEASTDAKQHRNLAFRIEGVVLTQPLPLNLYLRSEVDLETGHHQISEVSS